MRSIVFLTAALALGSTAPLAQAAPPCDLGAKPIICSIENNYDPKPPPPGGENQNYKTPICESEAVPPKPDRSGAAGTAIRSALTWLAGKSSDAQRFVNDICGLERIFVITDKNFPHSWGKWEDPTSGWYTPPAGKKYVGLTVDDAQASLADKFDGNLRGALAVDRNFFHYADIAQDENTTQLAIIFALAHELGHLQWRNAFGYAPTAPQDCFDLSISWTRADNAKTRAWTDYGEQLGAHRDKTIPWPHKIKDGKLLRNIYDGGFMTALAAANPEEDFVETYAIALLMSVSKSHVYLKVDPADHTNKSDILVNGNRDGNLDWYKKVACVVQFVK